MARIPDSKSDAQTKPRTAGAASPCEPGPKRLLQTGDTARARFYQAALAGPKDTKWKSG